MSTGYYYTHNEAYNPVWEEKRRVDESDRGSKMAGTYQK